MDWIHTLVQGVLIGGLYAMFAAGLSLIFGVMRLVNIAHGDFIVLAAYLALVVTETLGIAPLPALLVVVPLMGVIGYVLQRLLLNRTLGDDLLPPLLVTFGLSVIIQNGLLELFTADSRRLQAGAIEVASIPVVPGISIGVLPLLQFAVAVAVIGGMQFVFYRTALGRAFRATSDDQAVAQLMGLDNRHVFALGMPLSLAVVAVAGVLIAVRTNFDPAIGPARLIFGFEAVIIGGLGSLWGTLFGGILLGVAQGIGAPIDPGWQMLAGHLAFLIVLAGRPERTMRKARCPASICQPGSMWAPTPWATPSRMPPKSVPHRLPRPPMITASKPKISRAGPIAGSKLVRTAMSTPATATTASDSAMPSAKTWRLFGPLSWP